jgi:hypothetical protein
MIARVRAAGSFASVFPHAFHLRRYGRQQKAPCHRPT